MKNTEIIRQACLANKLFGEDTEEKMQIWDRMNIPIPIHNEAQWVKEGYRVKEDQDPALILKLWKVSEDAEGNKSFRLVPTKLYTVQQCLRVNREEESYGCIQPGDTADYC